MKTWQEEGFDSPEQQISVHAIRAKLKLQTGDYCEVTREQAIELLTIEGTINVDHYISIEPVINYVWWHPKVILISVLHSGTKNYITFEDFKQRLINTVKK